MKRKLYKDILLVLWPSVSFLLFSWGEVTLRYAATASYDYTRITTYNSLVPVVMGVILCLFLLYAWENRASTVFISLWFGAFLTNMLLLAGHLGMLDFLGLSLRGLFHGGVVGPEVGVAMVGAYALLFWCSLVCFIRKKLKK